MPHRKSCLIFIIIATPLLTSAQPVQWASKVISFSSQFGTLKYSAAQALGAPNCLPQGGDLPGAWAMGGVKLEGDSGNTMHESPDPQYIKLGYARPMKIRQVSIAENNAPGAVQIVTLYDEQDAPHIVYTVEPAAVSVGSRMLDIFFPITTFNVAAVRVDMQPGKVPGWNEIDAVGISESADSVKARINFVPNMPAGLVRENLGKHVNTEYADFGPVITPDGKTLYFIRVKCPTNTGGETAGADIYASSLESDGTWSYADNIGKPLNNEGYNSIESVTPDGNTVLLTNQYHADGSSGGGGLSMSHREASGWSIPTNLVIANSYQNGKNSENCLSPDGKAILKTYERNDTRGGNDIYVSFLLPDTTWSEPMNIGSDVNTIGDEVGPFLAADGTTMYFSTDGLPGYGDNDVYVTRRLDSTWLHWSTPQNLGPDINSDGFDAYYTTAASGDYAYFSSTKDSYGRQDIYRIALPKVARPRPVVLVSGHVYNAKTRKPLEAGITYEMLATGAEPGVARSNPADGAYKISLPAGAQYGFRAEAPGFYPVSDNLDTRTLDAYTELKKDLFLAPLEIGQAIRLNNIFFEFAKAELKNESFPELNRAAKFMKENATVEVEIQGHTDNVGGDASNVTLSQNRAESVVNYLVGHGIANNRLKAKGYGKSKPVATNDTEEGRQMNRRVEFTIVKQ